MNSPVQAATPERAEGWRWWEKRRLAYNAALAGAGLVAYLLSLAVGAPFGDPPDLASSAFWGVTLLLGLAYLVFIGVANVCYLAGPLAESIVKPADRDAFRRRFFSLGFILSVALPFLFPLASLAIRLSGGPD